MDAKHSADGSDRNTHKEHAQGPTQKDLHKEDKILRKELHKEIDAQDNFLVHLDVQWTSFSYTTVTQTWRYWELGQIWILWNIPSRMKNKWHIKSNI